MSSSSKQKINLPVWRCKEIQTIALPYMKKIMQTSDTVPSSLITVCEIIAEERITVIPYSALTLEEIQKLQKFNLSFWQDGMCLIHSNQNSSCTRYIYFNDHQDNATQCLTIFHELSHIILGHTQQCLNAEAEAFYLSGLLMGTILLKEVMNQNELIHADSRDQQIA